MDACPNMIIEASTLKKKTCTIISDNLAELKETHVMIKPLLEEFEKVILIDGHLVPKGEEEGVSSKALWEGFTIVGFSTNLKAVGFSSAVVVRSKL